MNDTVKDIDLISWKKENKPKYKVWQVVEVQYDNGMGTIRKDTVIIASIGVETEDWNGLPLSWPRYVYRCFRKNRKGDGPPSPFYDKEIINVIGEIEWPTPL